MTEDMMPAVRRENIKLVRDSRRVITRTLISEDARRVKRTIDRVLNLTDGDAAGVLEDVRKGFHHRHKDLNTVLLQHFGLVAKHIPPEVNVSNDKKMLIGAYVTMEYSIESAALFNPSIVQHPDQTNLSVGSLRFIMSLRATGEGHISSIVFRTGIIGSDESITLEENSRFAETAAVHRETSAADSDYLLQFHPDQQLSERVIFPVMDSESKGIEDARFVRFIDEKNSIMYYATYTAYDGFNILPRLIETKDFLSFKIVTLRGTEVKNKGMGLFPRKINGTYYMLSRQDGENNYIMSSNDLHYWDNAERIQEPIDPWEFVQIGNCGSPMETNKGWLVLTHGVGPMRKYSIGAMLLDLENPKKIIARLERPLLSPNEEEREGYVPNVVYSCGSLIHNDTLILPYAMSDITSGVATVNVNELLSSMKTVI